MNIPTTFEGIMLMIQKAFHKCFAYSLQEHEEKIIECATRIYIEAMKMNLGGKKNE